MEADAVASREGCGSELTSYVYTSSLITTRLRSCWFPPGVALVVAVAAARSYKDNITKSRKGGVPIMGDTNAEGSEVDSGSRVENTRIAEVILGCNCKGCSVTRVMHHSYLNVAEAEAFLHGDLSLVGMWRIVLDRTCLT